jgi:hypothetical protein
MQGSVVQGGVGMQRVTASERLAKRKWDWDANADKASVSATSWLQGGCSCTDTCPAITPFSR